MKQDDKSRRRIYEMSFASVYPLYIAKVGRKGRTKEEVDEIIRWLTGYSQKGLESELENQSNFQTFFDRAPKLNPDRFAIRGVICGVRVEEIDDRIVRLVRLLDLLVDKLARGQAIEKILLK